MKPAKAVLLICSLFYFSVISAQTITASNGLTKSSNDIQLRGTLNQATAIDLGSTFTFKFSKAVSNYFFPDNTGNPGIGTGSPAAQWHTTGSALFQGLTTNNTLTNIPVADANGNLSVRDASIPGGGPSNITSLNGLTGSTQTFAVGTTGSNFTISSSGSTHTFNIPDASLTARGFVSTGTQTFEGQKTFNASTSFNGSVNTVTLNLAGSGVINFSNGIIGIATPDAGHGILFTKTDKKLYYKDDSGTEFDLTASGSIASLNGLTGSTQTFAVGTTGSDFTISSSGSTHTFNIPDASLTARGFVNTGTQTFEGQKTFNGTTIFNGALYAPGLIMGGMGVIDFSNAIIGIATPPPGHGTLFTKTNKKLYYKDDSGTEYDLTSGGGTNYWTQSGTDIYYTNTTGNVGIGTNDTRGYRFAVNGDAIFTKVKVKQYSTWPDYVLGQDYKIPTLAELEKYIQQNRHLPDVPSADEVEKNGLDLGDSQAVLLKKIEELTLYIIDINKKVEKLSEENAALKKKLESKNK